MPCLHSIRSASPLARYSQSVGASVAACTSSSVPRLRFALHWHFEMLNHLPPSAPCPHLARRCCVLWVLSVLFVLSAIHMREAVLNHLPPSAPCPHLAHPECSRISQLFTCMPLMASARLLFFVSISFFLSCFASVAFASGSLGVRENIPKISYPPKLLNSQRFARTEGVGLGERAARTAKQPQGPERKQSILRAPRLRVMNWRGIGLETIQHSRPKVQWVCVSRVVEHRPSFFTIQLSKIKVWEISPGRRPSAKRMP